ncbi:MAG: methyltransferase domain-containing protein [Armatimonadetes bacterium]|nr:methyltransferase domain-containing protein [Armatimonadota bacterium]MDE2207637.1 methyltransferase domain-containing protein [Armatimonadota bacterium]
MANSLPENYASFAGGIAEAYAQLLAPILFDPWLNRVRVAARIAPGDRVLDVASGPGRFGIRTAQLEPSARVLCVDASESMICQALRGCHETANVKLVRARAEQLAVKSTQFDVVTCLFGLMFFRDRLAALTDMARALRPGGCLLLTTWAGLMPNDFAGTIVAALEAQLPKGAQPLSRLPHSMGGTDDLRQLIIRAGFQRVNVERLEAQAEARSVQAAVTAFTLGTPVVLELMQRGVVDLPTLIRGAVHWIESKPGAAGPRHEFRRPSRALLVQAVTQT